jgi:hypothetical protein
LYITINIFRTNDLEGENYLSVALTLRVEVWDVVLSIEQWTMKGIDTN